MMHAFTFDPGHFIFYRFDPGFLLLRRVRSEKQAYMSNKTLAYAGCVFVLAVHMIDSSYAGAAAAV